MDYKLEFWALVIGAIIASIFLERLKNATNRLNKVTKNRKVVNPVKQANKSSEVRPDDEIIKLPLNELNGYEFERIFALYFRDKGYKVDETGVGGKDGGVDLVIKDPKTGERTAIQAKCFTSQNVKVQVVRELVGAKFNFSCRYARIITTTDLTKSAKDEAQNLRCEYWNGRKVEYEIKKWKKKKRII